MQMPWEGPRAWRLDSSQRRPFQAVMTLMTETPNIEWHTLGIKGDKWRIVQWHEGTVAARSPRAGLRAKVLLAWSCWSWASTDRSWVYRWDLTSIKEGCSLEAMLYCFTEHVQCRILFINTASENLWDVIINVLPGTKCGMDNLSTLNLWSSHIGCRAFRASNSMS